MDHAQLYQHFPRTLGRTLHQHQSPARVAGCLFFHREFDSSPYASLSLWTHGGPEGGQLVQTVGLLAGANPVTNNVYYRFTAPSNDWQKITIPLGDLGVADNTNFTGFWFQLANDITNTFYIDDIQLDAKPKPVATATAAQTQPTQQSAPAPVQVPLTQEEKPAPAWWIAGMLTVIAALLAWLVLMLRKSGLGKKDVLTPSSALARRDEGENWRERALVAEDMAVKQAKALSEKVIPELTEFAKQSLVQGLYSQRDALLETQRQAQLELLKLEARLADLQLPLHERILAYENRITELESELNTRGEEMRELTKATLMLMRQKLEEEKEREPGRRRFN
jgi:hypothetical protein